MGLTLKPPERCRDSRGIKAVSCLNSDDEEKWKVAEAVGRCWLQCQLVGGGSTCLWLSPSPSSLLWRKRQMESKGSCSTPSDASSVCPALSLPGLKATCQGNMGTLPGTQPSTATRVNCLQRGVGPLPILPPNTLLPPRGRVQLLQLCFKDVVEWRQFFIQMKYALSRSCQMPNLNLSTLETSCKGLIFQWDWDWTRGAKLDTFYILTWSCIISKECFAWLVTHVNCGLKYDKEVMHGEGQGVTSQGGLVTFTSPVLWWIDVCGLWRSTEGSLGMF